MNRGNARGCIARRCKPSPQAGSRPVSSGTPLGVSPGVSLENGPASRSAPAAALPGDELVVQVAYAAVVVPLPVGPELPGGGLLVEGQVQQGADLLDDVLVAQPHQ